MEGNKGGYSTMNRERINFQYEAYLLNVKKSKESAAKDRIRRIQIFLDYLEETNNYNVESISLKEIESFLNFEGSTIFSKNAWLQHLKVFFRFLNHENLNNLNLNKYSIGDFKIHLKTIPISKEELVNEINNMKNNGQIAIKYNLSERDVKTLKRFYGINKPPKLSRENKDNIVKNLFESQDFSVSIENNAICRYTINGKIMIAVSFSTSISTQNQVRFNLQRDPKHFREVDTTIFKTIKNGTLVPRYEDLCDFVVFIGLVNDKAYVWILSSEESNIFERGRISFSINPESIHSKWRERWDMFHLKLD